MSGTEIELGDVFSRTQIWGIRAFGVGAFLLSFGGAYAIRGPFTLVELGVVTMVAAAFAALLTMSAAVRLAPSSIEFDFKMASSRTRWTFVYGLTFALAVWLFVIPVGVVLVIAAQFITFDALLTSCLVGGTLQSMSIDWLELNKDNTVIRKVHVSSTARAGGPTKTDTETPQNDSVSLDNLQTDPVEALADQDEEPSEQHIRSAIADVRDSIKNHEFSEANSELERLASKVRGFEEREDIPFEDLKQELRALRVETDVERARSKIANGRDALGVDQSSLARKLAEEAKELLDKARQFAETHELEGTNEIDDVEAEAELLGKQARATEQSHEKESSERERATAQTVDEIRSRLADVRELLDRGNLTSAEYKLDKARDATECAAQDASTTDDVTALRDEEASLRVEIRLEKAQKKVAEADSTLESGEIDTAQEKASKARNMLESARQFATEQQLDLDDRIADIESDIEALETRAKQFPKATEYLNEAKAAFESGDLEEAKKSLHWFDVRTQKSLEWSEFRINHPDIPTDLESDASKLIEQIAAAEEAETLLSEANTGRQQAKHRLDAGQFGKACELARGALEKCQQAEQSEFVEQADNSLSIEGIRSDLEVILEKSEPVVERIEEAKDHRDTARSAIESESYEEAETALQELDSTLETLSEHDNQRIEQLRSDARQLEDSLETAQMEPQVKEILDSVDDFVTDAESVLEDGSLEQAYKQLITASDILREATTSSEAWAPDYKSDIGARLEQIEMAANLVEQANSQMASAQRALQSRSFDKAQSTISKLDNTVDRLANHDALDLDPSGLRGTVERLESELEIGRAEDQLNELLGAVESAWSQTEELLEDGNYNRAITRLESALDTLDDVAAVNDRYGLGYSDRLSERRDRVESLLEDISTDAKEHHADTVERAEKAVARGINCRNADDPESAVKAFEEAHEYYSDALELAREQDLPELWETEQRHSMVSEYLEVAREELEGRRQSTEEELTEALDRAETAIVRAEQYAEVDDHVSVRETLDDVVSHLDEATQLLNVAGVTDELRSRYDALVERADALREVLPDEEQTSEYRNQDLVESLQVLTTKLGESPRPEFVNEYGEYPADAYLEAFGSWPEALAASNLDQIDEDARERRTYSRVNVLDELVCVADDIGRPPSKSEMNEHGSMSSTTVVNRFQDWGTALEIADITGSKEPKKEEESSDVEMESSIEEEPEEPTTSQSSILDQIEKEINSLESAEDW